MNENTPPLDDKRPWGTVVLTTLLLLTLAFVAATFFLLARDARHEQSWVRLVTTAQVASQQLSKSAGDTAIGNPAGVAELATARTQLSGAIRTLQSGSVTDRLPPVPRLARDEFDRLAADWRELDRHAGNILGQEALLKDLDETVSSLKAQLPEAQSGAARAVEELTEAAAPARQVAAASRLVNLLERIMRSTGNVLDGGAVAEPSSAELGADVEQFERTLAALLNGEEGLGVARVRPSGAVAALGEVSDSFAGARPQLDSFMNSYPALLEMRGASDEIHRASRRMFDKAEALSAAITGLQDARLWPSMISGVAGLVAMLVIAAMLVRAVIHAERQRATVATSRDRHNQRAISRLVKELGSLAKGDLTVHATVGDEITRDIATATNYAVKRLRELVAGINETSRAVSESAQATHESASLLAESAGQQAEQVGAAAEDIRQVASAFDAMARQSQASSEVAHRSVEIAHNGAQKVGETITGMDLIRDQIQETSKRIKRLGESTQEIGDIVGLINGIAEQTNVLALNAAIQAASAGGTGKGFAMVADEVQELAESATQATRRIESLVQTIQADTSEAVHSMEATTSEVVRGAHLAEDAGDALQKIESVSNDLAAMIHQICAEAQSQSETATRISELMDGIQEVSSQTSLGTRQTAEEVANLAELVLRLSASVSDFKLPRSNKPADS